MSMYYAEPLAPQIFRSSYSQEKKREADIEHLTSQIGLLAEKVRESSKLKPEVASKTLSTLSKMEKSSFNKTLDEETCADMIDGKPPSPDVIPKGILLNKPDDKQTVENKERKKKKGITRYFLATSLKQHKKDFEALKTTNKRKEQKSDKEHSQFLSSLVRTFYKKLISLANWFVDRYFVLAPENSTLTLLKCQLHLSNIFTEMQKSEELFVEYKMC